MFTGIVRELGEVVSVETNPSGLRLELAAPATAALSALGDSVAVDGCCLTVVSVADDRLAFDAIPETLARTTLKRLVPGARVNLEPALRAGDPLGGHYVQGHVDGVGRLLERRDDAEGRRLVITAPDELLRYIVEKGSITVEGVSLTVAALVEGGFAVALIPQTLAATTLASLDPGDAVNLEVDVLAKYVERLLPRR
jgi:riboflavin synthase